ncbi:MAG: hypothetical protein EXX96DRAFT_477634 [Benjaminiella poitrasii]|nr:MAG: hypothetical protein EXX96DRAFT_477634 [Benjaminiella poitrasii]
MFPQSYNRTATPGLSPPLTSHEPRKKKDPLLSRPTQDTHASSDVCEKTHTLKEDPAIKTVVHEDTNDVGHAVYFSHTLDNVGKSTRLRLTAKWFNRAASIGDLPTMQQMLADTSITVDVNGPDDESTGITSLMYASYFGHIECLNLLIDHPSIDINKQDNNGWTALLWAIHGENKEAVEILLDKGSNTLLCTNKGRTILDYPTSKAVRNLLEKNPACIKSSYLFSWNQCLPDQMFVFSPDNMHFIVDHALYVADFNALMNKGPLSSKLWQPANIIFLSARFAHYCHSKELLHALLTTVTSKLARVVKTAAREVQPLAFWIANICQLSSYFRKDAGLSISAQDALADFSELESTAYIEFITETQRKIEKVLEPSLMDYESIEQTEPIDFVGDWQRFFRRTMSISSNPEQLVSPHSVTAMLQQTQSILQSYHVPPAIVIQAIAQIFHYLSCEVFNRVLTYKKYLCRSKALQIRMNISIVQDWVHANKLPGSLNHSFQPLVQLLQLLQCLSQMDDAVLFSSTVETFDRLNALQVKRCVQNYRYEVSETKLSEPIEKLVNDEATNYQEKHGRHNNRLQTKASIENFKYKEKRNSNYMLPFSPKLLRNWTEEQNKASPTESTKDNILLYSEVVYKEIKLKKREESNHLDKVYPVVPEEWLYHVDKKLHTR